MNDRFVLGTVQFGLDYGVSNETGRVGPADVKSILHYAAASGIDTLDTAIAYGDSESTLGQAGVGNWKVITKLPVIPDGCVDVVGWVEAQTLGALNRLGLSQLHGVLLHRPEQLLGEDGKFMIKALQHIKAQGMTQKVGVSVYGPEELDSLKGVMQFDLVQAPMNILDRRLVDSGWAKRLKEQGVEIHVRSAFLQGLLLMEPTERPEKFSRWRSIWSEWSRWLGVTALTPLQACLGYALGVQEAEKVVVGVNSVKQLQEVIAASQLPISSLPNWPQVIDADLIDPRHWRHL
jgi:aryl-alcohol dehydrogenase-like predicted oxidoreductase